jgi:hypothetical protein
MERFLITAFLETTHELPPRKLDGQIKDLIGRINGCDK